MLSHFDVGIYGPLILSVAVPYAVLALLGPRSRAARLIASTVCIACGARYLWWRWTQSMPVGQGDWQQAWAWVFLVFESATICSSLLIYFFMTRTRDRSGEVDARAGSPRSMASSTGRLASRSRS